MTDEQILAGVRDGGRAYHIADRIGAPDSELRRITRRLLAMERKGLVRRSERYSVPNSYYWELPA